MYCPNCGEKNSDGSKFCSKCGEKLDTPFKESSGIQNDTSFNTKDDSSGNAEQGFFHKTAGKFLIFVIIIAVAVLAVIAVMRYRSVHQSAAVENLEDEAAQVIEEDEGPESVIADISYDPDSLSEERQNMLGPMDSAAYALNSLGGTVYTYDWNDDEYVWDALYCLICNYRGSLMEETDAVTAGTNCLYVTEDFLKECASAMFADFDGQLPTSGMGGVTKEGDLYRFGVGDRGDEYARISSWIEHSDGTCTAETQILIWSTGELMLTFRFELVKNTYTESEENPYYVYSVASVENIYNGISSSYSDTIDDADYYILPESSVRYYTEDELKALTKEELRLARNEIYARHGRTFDSEDIQSYFDDQPWYQGTIAPADFSESMLNEYEKANIKTIQSLEDGSDNTGNTNQNVQSSNDDNGLFESSWEAIKNFGLKAGDWLYHDYSSGKYNYSYLSFNLYLDTLTDMGDYYFVEAVFNKPVIVSTTLNSDERYTAIMDELDKSSAALSAMEASNSFGYVMGSEGEKCTMSDADGNDVSEVYYDSDDRLDEPFYRGVLRIRKDAVTGASITYGPYKTVDISVLRADDGWYNGVAFDDSGYVTQLLYLGD